MEIPLPGLIFLPIFRVLAHHRRWGSEPAFGPTKLQVVLNGLGVVGCPERGGYIRVLLDVPSRVELRVGGAALRETVLHPVFESIPVVVIAKGGLQVGVHGHIPLHIHHRRAAPPFLDPKPHPVLAQFPLIPTESSSQIIMSLGVIPRVEDGPFLKPIVVGEKRKRSEKEDGESNEPHKSLK